MPACESKLVSTSSRKATVVKTDYRPRSRDRMPSLVGDRGQVLQVHGWAITRIHNLSLVLRSVPKGAICFSHMDLVLVD